MADQTMQRSFTGGEIAPALRSRADMDKYISGLALCKDFIVRPQGGVYSRPGLLFIGELDDMTRRGRLIPFEFNTEQTYVLVFEHLKMRVITNGGYVVDEFDQIYELVTPYTEDELPRLIFVQDADVMTITHRNHDPKRLSRLDNDDWALATISYASDIAAPTGVGSASVGSAHGAATKSYTYVVTAVSDDEGESIPSSSTTISIGSLTVTGGVRISWSAVTGAAYYRVYRDPSNGSGIYGWIGDSKTLQFDDFNFSPLTSDAPPSDFLPFTGERNKPATVGYYQQRQIFANTLNEPQKVFCSQSGIYESMRSSSPSRDDDALFFTIKSAQVNEIRHIVSLDALILLTSSNEQRVTEGQDMVLTPFTIGVRAQSYWGASWTRPASVGDSVIFVQEKGNRVRDLRYEYADDRYQGNELSIMAEHLFSDHTIEEMTYALEPFGVLWCVRDDGVLLGMTYQREQSVWAWHQHTTLNGQFESITTISEDGRDAVYVIVKRTFGETVVRYVERFEKRIVTAAEDVFCVDSGLMYTGSPATTFAGLHHLEGQEVVAVADGNVVRGLEVISGLVNIPFAASKVSIGLPYIPTIETLDIDMQSMQQSLKGVEKSVSNVQIEVVSSRGGWVGGLLDGGGYDTLVEIPPRFDSDGYDEIALKSFKQSVPIQPMWSKGGGLRIEQRDPMPMAILSVVADVDFS
jgi:hypothetical protein